MMTRFRLSYVLLAGATALCLAMPVRAAQFEKARIYIEYNETDNDLGFHVLLDGEDWKLLKVINPRGATIFQVTGKGGYADLGLTELFFEGAEPALDEFPLEELLAYFPEGKYTFIGTTVDGAQLKSTATLSHAVPQGPLVSAEVNGTIVAIRWQPVAGPPAGFPSRRVDIVGYQVIVGSFQVTLPAWSTEVTLPAQFVEALGRGEHEFEVLAIEASGNQTIAASSFEIE